MRLGTMTIGMLVGLTGLLIVLLLALVLGAGFGSAAGQALPLLIGVGVMAALLVASERAATRRPGQRVPMAVSTRRATVGRRPRVVRSPAESASSRKHQAA